MISKKVCNCTMKKLKGVETPFLDQVGSNWKGVKHYNLLTQLEKSLSEVTNHKIEEWRLHLWYHDMKLHASCKIPIGSESISGVLGLASSNDGNVMLTFFTGLVEDDVPLITDRFQGGKYTFMFDIESECNRAAASWKNGIMESKIALSQFQKTRLPEKDYESLILRVGRDKILPWTKIGQADSLWLKTVKRTAWDFYRSVAVTVGKTSGPKQMNNLYNLEKIVAGKIHELHLMEKSS